MRVIRPLGPTMGVLMNNLPDELIGHIFLAGKCLDDEDVKYCIFGRVPLDPDDDSNDGLPGNQMLPFAVNVSHVCREWRRVAISTPNLWTNIALVHFPDRDPLEKLGVYLERSKFAPLDISITQYLSSNDDSDDDTEVLDDLSIPRKPTSHSHPRQPNNLTKSQLAKFLRTVAPHACRWRRLSVDVARFSCLYMVLMTLSEQHAAPILETLELRCEQYPEQCVSLSPAHIEEWERRPLPFNGNTPKLRNVTLGVGRLDWARLLPILSGLGRLELPYHRLSDRVPFPVFKQIVANSPNLSTLVLSRSGPKGLPEFPQGLQPFQIPSLRELVLWDLDLDYAKVLVKHFDMPSLKILELGHFGDADCTELALEMTRPVTGRKTPMLAGLTYLKINGFRCSKKAVQAMLTELINLKLFYLRVTECEEFFVELLRPSKGGCILYCPHLAVFRSVGIDTPTLKGFVKARKRAGVPLRELHRCAYDYINNRDEKWLRKHLEDLRAFCPSDWSGDEDDGDPGWDDYEPPVMLPSDLESSDGNNEL